MSKSYFFWRGKPESKIERLGMDLKNSENGSDGVENHQEGREGKKGAGNTILEDVWAFLSSMRVGIFLLLLLTGMSIYGATFLTHQEALQRVYSSWWFIGTLVVAGLNLIVCSINRWETLWKRATFLNTAVSYESLDRYREKASFPVQGPGEKAAQSILEFMRKKGYRSVLTVKENGFLISADKGRFGHFGSLVTHISLVLLLLAAFIGIVSGFETFDGGFPGRIFPVPEAGVSVRIDGFEIKYRDDRSIEQFFSTLTIFEDGKEVKQETIFVNKPLRYKGVAFYQSSYGWGVDLRIANEGMGQGGEEVTMRAGQVYQHPETGLRLYMIEFFPDFSMTSTGVPFSRSDKPLNPRVAYTFYDAAGQLLGQQYYLADPTSSVELPGGYTLEFLGWRNYTGFQIARNPGKPLALAASLLMLAGLSMSFYLFPRRVWAYVGEEEAGKVLICGQSHRNKVGFELEFKRLVKDLRGRQEG
jgi:cytochrome c biogenesis protein